MERDFIFDLCLGGLTDVDSSDLDALDADCAQEIAPSLESFYATRDAEKFSRLVDDMDDEASNLSKGAIEKPFANPLALAKHSVGFRLRICREQVVERNGKQFREGIDDRNQVVWSREIEEE
jgi:hypothetical protein